ncbi:MAG: hypothetical protein L0Z62_37585 [Gemmataceae bacterium]|nr:hypothetical protein [Gemmataceae bacterium]
MDEAFQAQLTALGNEVRSAAIPDGCKQTAAWCLGQLPNLYAQFRQTSESRYGEAITRLVQGILKALAASQRACPEAQHLATRVTECFQILHEQYGLPALHLKPVGASPPRSRKVG